MAWSVVSVKRFGARLGARFCAMTASALLCVACATDPIEPPTELTSIKAETKLKKLWSTSLSKSKQGRFEPFIQEGVLYAASQSGDVVALNSKTGKVQWRRKLVSTLGSGVGGDAKAVYVSTVDGVIIALNIANGNILWESAASSEVLTPVSAGFDSVVVRSADGRILSLAAATGEEQWSTTYTPPALTLNGYSRPLLLDGGVLVGLDDGRLLALGSEAGNVIWESVISVPSGRSEVERLVDIDGNIRVDDSAIYVVNYQGKLARIEPAKGQILWSVPMSSTAGLAISDKAAVVITDNDEVHAFNKENGQPLWEQSAFIGRRLTAPQIVGDDLIVVGDLEGYIHILNSADGRLIGRSRVGKKALFPEIVLAEKNLFIQSSDGTLAALSANP